MTQAGLSKAERGVSGIVGHAGVGHVHSHSGFVQDDSAGFAVAASILKLAHPVDTTVSEVRVSPDTDEVTVVTADGGVGTVKARRGVTPAEAEIARRALGEDALYSQRTAVKTFGRMYGQGALELPVALQGACALAVLDTFQKKLGGALRVAGTEIPGNYDRYAGAVVDIDGVPVSLMLVINGTEGGVGPNEDGEGNTNYGAKGDLMHSLALDAIPSVVVESKAFIPTISAGLEQNRFMIRAQKGVDCTKLGQKLLASAQALKLPAAFEETMMPFTPGGLARGTEALADAVIELAERLKDVDSSAEKVQLVAKLNQLLSEDAGGVTFMSNSVNDVMRGAGTLPKISAVLSLVTAPEEANYWKIPLLTEEECRSYRRIIFGALQK